MKTVFQRLFFTKKIIMRKNQNFLTALGCVPLLAAVLVTACKKEKKTEVPHRLPVHYILESEKLVIPSILELPAHANGYTRLATFYATGIQKYKAQQKLGTNPASYEWVFIAPQADLYNASNQKVGTHGAGPFWQLSVADSIFAQAINPPRVAPSPDSTSIDWLLLVPKFGKTPSGLFSEVSYIHRIATRGGRAPVTLPQQANETVDVPYTAIYRFTKKNP
jgi:hypothetical protein